MSQRELTKAELQDRFGESHKQIERYVSEGMPCEGTGRARRFPWPECRNWRDERVRRMEREATEKRLTPATENEVEQAHRRRAVVESRLLDMQLAEREGSLIAAAHVEEVVGEIGERMRAVLINLPSNYSLHLERAGVEPATAQSILEVIADDLTRALRGTADELEADDADAAD